MKLVISDIHLGNHQQFATLTSEGVNSRLLLQEKAITKALVAGNKAGCTILVIAGDIFHVRGLVEVEAVNVFKRVLTNALIKYDEVIILTGNHDITHENTEMFNSLNVFNEYKRVTVVNAGTILVREDIKSIFVGFTNKDENKIIEDLANVTKYRKFDLYTHQSIYGVQYRAKLMDEGFRLDKLKQFRRVFNGHIHEPNIFANVYNLGSLYPMDFGDVGERYYYIVSDKRVDAVQSDHPLFITVKNKKQINNDSNFYRIISEKQVDGVSENVKTVIQKKLIYDRGIDYSDSSSVIKSYCINIGKSSMAKHGVKILKEANK